MTIAGHSYTARNNGDDTWMLPAWTITTLAAGTYDVVVTVTDDAGNVTTTTTRLTVTSAASAGLAATGMNMLLVISLSGCFVAVGLILALRKRAR